jgi:DNA mismatch repair protein MutS
LEEVKNTVASMILGLNNFANYIAWFDLYTSHAIFANDRSLVKPKYREDGNISIKDGRHLVIEQYLEDNQQFIPNDLVMSVGGVVGEDNEN